MCAVEKWIVGGGPIFDSVAYSDKAWHAGHERNHDFSKRAAG